MSDNEIPGVQARDAALKLMRKPFEAHQISKMCKPTKKDNAPGTCRDCGKYHKLPSVQLSYVGHAALTDRLLEADPLWSWEPMAYAPDGTPFLDANGGLWIRLTVAGVTRLGYGDAQGKVGGDAMKERIGDALRNAAMRFGAALDLWHRGDLHADEVEDTGKFEKQPDGNFSKSTGVSPAKPATKAKAKVPPTPPNSSVSGQNSVPATGNVHGLDITDADLPDNMQPDRECTLEEHDAFRKRFIALKDKGYQNVGIWLLKTSGKPRTQDIGFGQTKKLVEQLEAADVAGTLKELLARD